MNRIGQSLRARLIALAGITLAVALAAAGWGLGLLFERHVERRVASELEIDLKHLIGAAGYTPGGVFSVASPPADQRYAQPFSGRYWQISSKGEVLARSRSLWDERLALPDDTLASGSAHQHWIAGPQGQRLLAVERMVEASGPRGRIRLRLAVAMDGAAITNAVRDFQRDLLIALVVLGTCLLAAFALALAGGLAPLMQLRADLGAVREGAAKRLAGRYPAEVAPLVEDLNALMASRDRDVAQAQARAADLAHGLKTPITAVGVIADELAREGRTDIACELGDYAARMQRHLEIELTRARSRAVTGRVVRIQVREAVDAVVRLMSRLPRGDAIGWVVEGEALLRSVGDEALVTEMLGCIIDNARKWARSQVQIQIVDAAGSVRIAVLDDGSGIPSDQRHRALGRGGRLDQQVPGSGFGLAIAAEIAEGMGGAITLGRAPLGGLSVTLNLPNGVARAQAGKAET